MQFITGIVRSSKIADFKNGNVYLRRPKPGRGGEEYADFMEPRDARELGTALVLMADLADQLAKEGQKNE